MKVFSIITLGLLSTFAMAAPAPEPQLSCEKDGTYCEPCVGGKQNCVACADGTGIGFTRNC